MNTINEAIYSGTNLKARIIQKYIENPLIIKNPNFKLLNKKKFDIRQWVLVKSFNPLKVYMFSSCYLRICCSEFNFDNIKDPFSHLTNFSLNKAAYQAKKQGLEDSVCSLIDFKEYLDQSTGKNQCWETAIKPKIINIIINSLKSVQDEIEQKNPCFELFGFDLILDEKLTPWLLEVNLSPACNERTEWLSHMLDDMAFGLLKIVLPSEWTMGIKGKQMEHKWELVYSEKDWGNKGNNVVIGSDLNKLGVEGVKIDVKKERNLDKRYFLLV